MYGCVYMHIFSRPSDLIISLANYEAVCGSLHPAAARSALLLWIDFSLLAYGVGEHSTASSGSNSCSTSPERLMKFDYGI